MSMRRNTGRERRIVQATSAETVDITGSIFKYGFAVGDVTKDGSNLLGTVNDLSGNARHVTQGTAGNKPLWVDDLRGAIDGATFDSGGVTHKRLIKTGLGTAWNTSYKWTLACVTRCTTAPGGSSHFNVIGTKNSATGREGAGQLGYYQAARTRRLYTVTPAAVTAAATFGDAPLNTWERWIVVIDGTSDGGAATVTAYVDGVSTAVSGSAYSMTIAANAAIFLGSVITTGAVDMLYVEGWNRALNAASVAALDTAMQAYA